MSNGTRSWDVYYFSPGGAKFRSKAAVARELGLEPPTRGGRGRKAADDDDDDEPPPKSRPPPLDEEEEIFSVDALLARRPAPKGGRGVEYLVRWEARAAAIPYSAIPPQFCAAAAHRTPFRRAQGYGRAEDLWVPAGNILDKSLVRVFEAARSKPPPPIGGSRGPPAERTEAAPAPKKPEKAAAGRKRAAPGGGGSGAPPPPLNLSPHEGRGGGGDHHEERNDVRTWSGAKPSPRPRPSLFGMGSPTHGPMSPGARPAPPPESDPQIPPQISSPLPLPPPQARSIRRWPSAPSTKPTSRPTRTLASGRSRRRRRRPPATAASRRSGCAGAGGARSTATAAAAAPAGACLSTRPSPSLNTRRRDPSRSA